MAMMALCNGLVADALTRADAATGNVRTTNSCVRRPLRPTNRRFRRHQHRCLASNQIHFTVLLLSDWAAQFVIAAFSSSNGRPQQIAFPPHPSPRRRCSSPLR